MDESIVLREKIKKFRQIIRKHRDAKGDDRCWLDDYFVWALIPGSPSAPRAISFEEGMDKCREFWKNRREIFTDRVPEDVLIRLIICDKDLEFKTQDELTEELNQLYFRIVAHRDIFDRPRTLEDDRKLYAVLPEKIPADFRLPPENEFLGEALAPGAGCPAFWRSHESCLVSRHDLHKWGPCQT